MTNKELSIKIFNLLLESEDSSNDWKNDMILRRLLWAILCLLLLLVLYVIVIGSFLLPNTTENLTQIIRVLYLVSVLLLGVLFTFFTYRYYILVIYNKYQVFLSNILFFYFFSIFIFSIIYFLLYTISPSLFIYPNSPYIPQKILTGSQSIGSLKAKLDFLLFSGFHGTGGSYNKIQSESILVSIISLIQSLYILSLVTLFISSFINQHIGKLKK